MIKKIICIILTALLFAGCVYAVHDCQTAQGVGYWFFLKYGYRPRLYYDVIADILFTACLVLLIIIPVLYAKYRSKTAFIRLFVLFVALMPSMRPDYVFGLLFDRASLPVYSLSELIANIAYTHKTVLLLFFPAMGFYKIIKGEKFKLLHIALPVLAVLLTLTSLFFAPLSPLLLFASQYLLIIVIHSFFERVRFESEIFYGFLYIVAVYNILFVTASAV